MSQTDLIIHDEKDNVAVVVIDRISKNQECNAWIMENDKTIKIKSINEIPLGHKIALQDFKEGDTILKYGHDIGKVVASIKKVIMCMFITLKLKSGNYYAYSKNI